MVDRMKRLLTALGAIVGAAFWGQGVGAQESDWCDRWGGDDDDRYCEVREFTFESDGSLVVDGGVNGGVSIEGWERGDVLVQARVSGRARSEARAEEIVSEIDVRADARAIEADGPDMRRQEGWAVSYRVFVPYETDLEIDTHNGGITITDVTGRIRFEALNGGVTVSGLAGDVEGHTTNGGLEVDLDGSSWQGEGLDVKTTNGGVVISVPDNYSAEFETGTVNGQVSLDRPLTVSGRLTGRIRATLGSGGPTVRAVTTNGGVRVVQRLD